MKKSLLFAAILGCFAFNPALHAAEEGISVTVTGQVPVRPDIAVFDVTVRSVDRQASKAASRTAETWMALQKALRSAGVPIEDSPSADYSVQPQWEWVQSSGKNVLTGYAARHVVRVTVRDIRRIGTVVDAALGAGAGDVGEIRFVPSKPEELRRMALDQAVRKAREAAAVMAKAAGGTLGALIELTSDLQQDRPFPVRRVTPMKAAQEAVPTEITPGEEEVSVTVHSRWRFVGRPVK